MVIWCQQITSWQPAYWDWR